MRVTLAACLARSCCTVGCCLALTQQAAAADPAKPLTEYAHTVWTHKDGIPSAFIYSIAQTRDGYLWLATTDGLVRFDGVRFVHWRPKTGHKALLGVVRTLCRGRDESLWLGTAAGLVGHIRGDDLTTASAGAELEALLEDRDGTLWAATRDRLLRFRSATPAQVGAAIALPGPLLSGPLQDRSGTIWLSTDGGVFRLDPRDPLLRLVKAATGKIWLSEDPRGIVRLTGPDGSTRQLEAGPPLRKAGPQQPLAIHAVLRDSDGNVWIGALGQGLIRIREDLGRPRRLESFSRRDGLSADRVWCLLEDREHDIWVGTQDGLNRLRDEKITTLTEREGLASASVHALAAGAGGAVWASTSAGIGRIDGEHRDRRASGVAAMSLSVAAGDALWAGTNRGVMRLQDGQWRYLAMPPGIRLQDVTAIAGDRDNAVWLCDAKEGLFRWAAGHLADFSTAPSLAGKAILAARGDGRGTMWFGLADGGAVTFDGRRFHAYSELDGMAGGAVNAVHVDGRGAVWIGTERGLSRFDGRRFVSWSTASGLPGERVLWILTDDGDGIWLGYSTGIAHVSRSELDRAARDPSHRVAHRFLDDGDGLQGNPQRGWQSQAVRASDGRLWFTTSEGVAIVDPRDLKRNLTVPPVHIERLVADGAAVDTARPVRLPPLTRDVEIDYTALSLAEPRKVRFRYQLEGFDPGWREAGARREAFFTNLPPRGYRFRVQACNNDGVWNEAGAILDLALLPAPYQTRWFSAMCVLLLGILAWGAYRLRVWQVTARLRGRFEERLKERTRIAQELHDSLLQDVLGISLQIEVADELLPAELAARQPLARALDLCKSTLQAGRRALNDLRTASLDAADLVQSFALLAHAIPQGAAPKVDVMVEGRERPLNAVTGHDVLQVGRQAVANAIQHAHARRIHVLLSYGEREFRLRVQDNGQGMSEQSLHARRPGHYGVAGMKERAERVGGNLSIRSREGEGTEVNLTVPAQFVYHEASS
jgi:signal transduction histidine kinase/ligand-binding sensor domain-containing protein